MSARSPLLAVLFAMLAAMLPSTALATDSVSSLVWDDGGIIAADGSLGTGGSATTHVTAYDAQHHPLAGVAVDILFPNQSVGSTSSVTLPSGCAASTVTFGGGLVSCTTDGAGRIPVQFTASGAVLPVGTTETIEARTAPVLGGYLIAQTTYSYLLVASLVWDDGGIIAADGSLGTGGSATTHVTAYDAQHHPLAGVAVDILFPNQSVGSTSSVTLPSGCAASTVTFGGGLVSCTTDGAGRIPVQFTASGAVLPVGTTETIEARTAPVLGGYFIAQTTYSYLLVASLVWDDGGIIAADGSLGTGGSATTHVTAYDAQHHPLAGVAVDILFPNQSVGSTSSVTLPSGCAASTVTFGGGLVSCTTDGAGRIAVQFTASGAVLPVGTTETIEARTAPVLGGYLIAQTTYSYTTGPGTPGEIRSLIWEDDGGFIAPDGSLGIGGTAATRLRAYDDQHAPVAGRRVRIDLSSPSPTTQIAPVDGSCSPSALGLDCITDADGYVAITYTASGVPQPLTEDAVIAHGVDSFSSSAVTRYRYANIRYLVWEDDGGYVAPDGSLGIGGTATTRLRAYDDQHAPIAGRRVRIDRSSPSPTTQIAPVDGSCSPSALGLDCITDADGYVAITYTASGVPQPLTDDAVIAHGVDSFSSSAVTRYRYANIRYLVWEDDGSYIAPDGSLGIGGTAATRLRAYDDQHAPVAGRRVRIDLISPSPTTQIAPVDGSCSPFAVGLDCITDADGYVAITYTASGVPQPLTDDAVIAHGVDSFSSSAVTRYRYGSPPPPPPSLTFEKVEDAASVIAGSAIGFTVTLSNSGAAGTGHATTVAIADPLPATAGLTWSLAPYSGPGTCTLSGGAGAQRVDCAVADLAPGAAITFHVTSPTTTASCGTSTNEATASAANAPTVTRTAGVAIVCPTTTNVTTELTSGTTHGTSLTIPAGALVTDQATISGSDASTATGDITYVVYSDNACGTAVATGGTKSVSGGIAGASDPVTLASAGTFWFVAAYSGDPTHLASRSGCADEVVHVVGAITATGLTTTSPLAFSGSVATFTSATPGATAGDFTATIDWGDGTPTSEGVIASSSGQFTVSGSHTYASSGVKTVGVTIHGPAGTSATATSTITVFAVAAGGGAFVISDRATTGTVTFWSPQWAKANPVGGGRAADTFKGYAKLPATPSCGTAWSTDPGNSGPPPAAPLPAYIAVAVTNTVTRSGSQVGGPTTHLVLVRTNPGYNPATGGAGTGTVVATIC